jgi:hypothetical protein
MKRILGYKLIVIIALTALNSCSTCNEDECEKWGMHRGPMTEEQHNQMMLDCDC